MDKTSVNHASHLATQDAETTKNVTDDANSSNNTNVNHRNNNIADGITSTATT